MKNFKEEELILYLYKEVPPQLHASITEALEYDLELQERLQVLRRTIQQLDKLKRKSPSRQSIREILKYAGKQSGKK